MSNSTNKIQRVLANLFLSLLSLLLVFLVSEMTARWFFSIQPLKGADQATDELHYPRPFVEAVASKNLVNINSLGYKGHLPMMPKPTGEFRIAIVGGSTVFGDHPNHDLEHQIQPLPGYLNEELQKRHGDHVRVYNFGITSTIAQQELARVVMDVVGYEPDLVVSYGGGNDFNTYDSLGYPHRFIWSEMNPLWITDLDEYPTFHLLALGSVLVRKFLGSYFERYFSLRVQRNRYFDERLPFYRDSVNNYSESIRRMEVISNAFGSQFIGYFQPLKPFYFGDKTEQERAESFRQNVERTVKNLGVKHYKSLKEVFEDSPESIWRDEIHVVDDANKKMAIHLANDLEMFLASGPAKGRR